MMQDKIIIGAGLYGLYSALYCGKKNENVLVIEKDDQAFKRATYINQARVHMDIIILVLIQQQLNRLIILKSLIRIMDLVF